MKIFRVVTKLSIIRNCSFECTRSTLKCDRIFASYFFWVPMDMLRRSVSFSRIRLASLCFLDFASVTFVIVVESRNMKIRDLMFKAIPASGRG